MRILYAEDERAISDAVSKILIKNNYSVDCVYDGEEALSYLDAVDYDMIILDIRMPKCDGIEVLKKIREKKNSIPVLLLTAKSELEDKIEGLDRGADDYLTKPFESKELLARLRAISRRGNGVVDDRITLSNLILSRSSFQLRSKDSSTVFTLNNKEFQILELLMTNPTMFFNKDTLMDKIWGFDVETDISVVWVYISNLRKKLNQIHSLVHIKSKRNLGYYLEMKDEGES